MSNQFEIATGLRKRPTYNELIDEIEKDYKLILPDRRATFLRNSPYLAFLDSGVYTEIAEQQEREAKHKMVQDAIRDHSSKNNQTFKANLIHHSMSADDDFQSIPDPSIPDPSEGSLDEQFAMLDQFNEMERAKQAKIAELVSRNLGTEEDPEQTRNFAAQMAQIRADQLNSLFDWDRLDDAYAKQQSSSSSSAAPVAMDESEPMDESVGKKRSAEDDVESRAKTKAKPKA